MSDGASRSTISACFRSVICSLQTVLEFAVVGTVLLSHGPRRDSAGGRCGMRPYGRALNCYWRMPFRQQARIELANEGKNQLTVYWQFDWMELPRVPKEMLYFHARYRQEFPAKPFSPYVIVEGRGEGHYVGMVLSIQCSCGSWFGDSDDRFYIDGEQEP